MKKSIIILGIIALTVGVCFAQTNNTELTNKTINMNTIEFIPKEFNDIQLGYNEDSETLCSQGYPNGLLQLNRNTIVVNAPQKIICNVSDSTFVPIIPICIAFKITERRELKYTHLSAKMAYIKKVNEGTEFFGEVYNKNMDNEYPAPLSYPEEVQKERIRKTKEVQTLSDEELEDGQASGGFLNVNLMEYVDMPFEQGKYEIYLSFSGLESNRVKVEIVFK